MNVRASIAMVLEALEVGDTGLAITVLLDLVDELPGDLPEYQVERKRPYRCSHCPMSFEWPGLLSHHLILGHGIGPE